MSDLPVQPTEEELNQFPQAPDEPTSAANNAEDEDKENLAKVSGADVDPNGEGEVHV